ncbi:MAG: glycogen synthase GlgA [Clostridiales bacterium]|nr:glycogen synthase GlgA [Clostridiales bacterium]
MEILFAASEAVPFATTGGLGDVIGSLPQAMKTLNMDCRVVLPLYEDVPFELRKDMHFVTNFQVPVAWRNQYCGVFETVLNGVTYYFLDNEYYFKRKGLYGHYDDAERFAFFSCAVLEMLNYINYMPDIIHANDWHTALIPAILKVLYACREGYRNIKCVLTVHNIQYQGPPPTELCKDILGIPEESYGIFEYKGDLNFMKAGLVMADAVTAVSPTYAQELKEPYFANGLDPIFNDISGRLSGILNGIDTAAYNPKTDQNIFQNYDSEDLTGKIENRHSLQKMLGLPEDNQCFIIAMVSRLVEAKGIDLVRYAIQNILSHHVQFILLGKGDWMYENYFTELAKKFPGRLAVRIGFMNDLAHKIYAGADAFLMPSKSEPCGLSQMVAMRYGTLPIVHETGGLKDSVRDCSNKNGNGFAFQTFNADDMTNALVRAETMFRDRNAWEAVMKCGMTTDFSWKKSAKSYQKLYKSLLV